MPYYNSPDNFSDMQSYISQIDAAGGNPIVVQALWDGDTQGWGIEIEVITDLRDAKEVNPTYEKIFLCFLRFASDLRIFNGQTEPWQETIIAQKIGKYLSEYYNIPFWFPSPTHPDNDCPSWLDRHKAIHCADCQKLIIPTDSPYLPKDICYPCNFKREQKDNFLKDKPLSDSLTLYVLDYKADRENFDAYRQWLYTTSTERGIYPKLKEVLARQKVAIETIESYELFTEDITLLKELYVTELKKLLEEQIVRVASNIESGFYDKNKLMEYNYEGNTYLIHHFLDKDIIRTDEKINDLHQLINKQQTLFLWFNRGQTTLKDKFLRFIYSTDYKKVEVVCRYFAELSADEQKTRVALTKDQSNAVLQRLVEAGYIEIDDNGVISITFKGNFYFV